MAQDVHRKDNHADSNDHLGKHVRELVELDLQRRQLVFCLGKGAGDLSHLGIHGGSHHHGATAAINYGGTHVTHVFTVAQRYVVSACCQSNSIGMFFDRHRLARESRLFNLHGCTLEHAAIGRNRVAGLEQNHVARHELAGMQHYELAIAHHLGLRSAHLLKCRQSLLALGLLNNAQRRVDDDDGHNDDDVCKVNLALNGARDSTDSCSNDEHNDHRVGHLLEEANP